MICPYEPEQKPLPTAPRSSGIRPTNGHFGEHLRAFAFTGWRGGADGGEAEGVKILCFRARVFAKELYDAGILSEEVWKRVDEGK